MSNASDFVTKNGVLKKYIGSGGNVVIPEGVKIIDSYAFEGCGSLSSITIPDCVTSISGAAFCNCTCLKNITIPDSVIYIGYAAFKGCSKLTSITIPDGVTKIGNLTFCDCSSLTSVTIPSSVNSIDRCAFRNCQCLTSITIPEGVKIIDSYAFEGCVGLTSIAIPDSVTYIDPYAFTDTAYYKDSSNWGNGSLYIGNHLIKVRSDTVTETYAVKEGTITINRWAFDDCRSLTSITIPESVTSIGEWVFEKCNALEDVTWPSALASELQNCMPKGDSLRILHIADISNVSAKFRPFAAVGFAEDGRDCTDENGKKYLKYIKSNAVKLIDAAISHPALLYLMIREKLIAAKDLEAVTNAVQQTGNTELIAAILDYGYSSVSEKDKAKVQQKKDERENNVTNFIFDTEKLEALTGKIFVAAGNLKTFVNRDELKECLTACGATLTETVTANVDYLIINVLGSGSAKNKKAVKLGIPRITEAQFNEMIGRKQQ